MKNQNIGICYFTNPGIEGDPFGKEVDGIMTSLARELPIRKVNADYEVTIVEELKPQNLPSVIFTDDSGKLEHIRIEGAKLQGVTLAKLKETYNAIVEYNKTNG